MNRENFIKRLAETIATTEPIEKRVQMIQKILEDLSKHVKENEQLRQYVV